MSSIYCIIQNNKIVTIFNDDQSASPPSGYAIIDSSDTRYVNWQTNQTSIVSNASVMQQIVALELAHQPRALRDAVLRSDNTHLTELDTQITALRGQLIALI